ncbi:MAG: CPBP family intramembrane metalloprotease [Rhodobacter sp.]|nr:CPBP family intramembrane metalloprotease [Rhodobacter sp.]
MASDVEIPARKPRAGALRRLEFGALYLAAPVAMAVLLPPSMMFSMLFLVTGVGIVLLHVTEGFRWRDLVAGVGRIDWRFVALFCLATVVVGAAVIWLTRPEAFLFLIRQNPGLMLAIALLYPLVSALPQEVVFRPLFFHRYAALLPVGVTAQVLLNSAIFSLAHLMYWSWIVAAMTFSGGLAFAWAYRVRGNFPEAVVLHSLAGVIVFALGLGVYFYSGNVVRPF